MSWRLPGERDATRQLTVDQNGYTGTIELLVPLHEVDPIYDPYARGFPRIGDLWPGMEQPQLRCTRIRLADVGVYADGQVGCAVTVEYATNSDLGDGYTPFYRVTVDGGVETLEAGTGGWTWETTGTPVTDRLQLLSQRCDIRVSGHIVGPVDEAPMLACLGCVNDRRFLGRPSGTLRLESYSWRPVYDDRGAVTAYGVEYTFQYRAREWNLLWRDALQARGADGRALHWQNEDDTQPTYTTDPERIGTPIWVNEYPTANSNPAGTGDWDRPLAGGEPLYEAVDFAFLLGIPPRDGDDPAGEPEPEPEP